MPPGMRSGGRWEVTLAALLAGCSGEPAGLVDPPAPEPDAAPPTGGLPECDPVIGEPDLALEMVAQGFDKPVQIWSAPNRDRLFVIEQHTARAWMVEDGQVLPEPFLDLGDSVSRAFEQGLLSLAWHPDFAANGRFFITYTRRDDALVLEEWWTSPDWNAAGQPEWQRELLAIEKPTNFHNGGTLGFGPDGDLYIGTGDGGPMYDLEGHAQDPGQLLGKFLRIDVDRAEGGLPYGIPPDNPFVGVAGARPEVWALGVRNPWGWSFDPATGHLYFGDVGLARAEEIDVIPAQTGGLNFGWPVLMGFDCVEPGCTSDGYQPPLTTYAYTNQELCSVIGGHVYRGCKMPGHHGKYFFSDFCAAFVRSFTWSETDPDAGTVHEWSSLSGALDKVSFIGVDRQGELLLVDWERGAIHRVVPAP